MAEDMCQLLAVNRPIQPNAVFQL